MLEVAIRINQLLTSNVNSLVDTATSPEKILKLLITDLEEAIISLSRDTGRAERAARDHAVGAGRHEAAAADWAEKARFAMDKKREDLARGALIERDRSSGAARSLRESAALGEAEAASFRETTASLEAKLDEARTKLTEVRGTAAAAAQCAASGTSPNRTDRIMDHVATLEKRFEFAQAAKPAAPGKSIDHELAEMARDAKLERELAEMRKAAKKAR